MQNDELPSISDYVSQLDADQLDCLLEKAKERQQAIREAGWAKVIVVQDEGMNYGFFGLNDYPLAVAMMAVWMCLELRRKQKLLGFSGLAEALNYKKPDFLTPEFQISMCKMRPEEAESAIAETRSEVERMVLTGVNHRNNELNAGTINRIIDAVNGLGWNVRAESNGAQNDLR